MSPTALTLSFRAAASVRAFLTVPFSSAARSAAACRSASSLSIPFGRSSGLAMTLSLIKRSAASLATPPAAPPRADPLSLAVRISASSAWLGLRLSVRFR